MPRLGTPKNKISDSLANALRSSVREGRTIKFQLSGGSLVPCPRALAPISQQVHREVPNAGHGPAPGMAARGSRL